MALHFPLHSSHGYRYVDEGPVSDLPAVVCLHGMLGDVTNWSATVEALSGQGYRVLVPVLPVYNMPMNQTNVHGLVEHVRGFLRALVLDPVVLAGNSLGGHVALFYGLQYPESTAALILTGSSGIFEVEMGTGSMRRRDRDFIRERAALTFYDPAHATDELVDNAFSLVNDRATAFRLIRMARSAQSETVTNRLSEIQTPTQLIWGRNDIITPPDVANEFQQHIPHAVLDLIDECGHAPMIEQPKAFNSIMLGFLRETLGIPVLASSNRAS